MLRRPFGYLDFLGGLGTDSEAARPVYRHLFRRLRALRCRWEYAPPALFVVSLDGGAAAAIRLALSAANECAFAEARARPPVIADAYREVYGCLPTYTVQS